MNRWSKCAASSRHAVALLTETHDCGRMCGGDAAVCALQMNSSDSLPPAKIELIFFLKVMNKKCRHICKSNLFIINMKKASIYKVFLHRLQK